jgi:hypothetical protein
MTCSVVMNHGAITEEREDFHDSTGTGGKDPALGRLPGRMKPSVGPLYAPYDPTKDGSFLLLPPEPEE